MKSAPLLTVVAAFALPLLAEAGPPVIESGSLLRVRADNDFGLAQQHDITPVFGFSGGDSIVD
ncbi:MAG TPA: hypothetical protein VGB99_05565 [Acidobacteriota bacterium]